MSIRLESAAGSGGGTAGMVDRDNARARQDKWMLEIERAMWASAARPAAPGREPEGAAETGPRGTDGAQLQTQPVVRAPALNAAGVANGAVRPQGAAQPGARTHVALAGQAGARNAAGARAPADADTATEGADAAAAALPAAAARAAAQAPDGGSPQPVDLAAGGAAAPGGAGGTNTPAAGQLVALAGQAASFAPAAYGGASFQAVKATGTASAAEAAAGPQVLRAAAAAGAAFAASAQAMGADAVPVDDGAGAGQAASDLEEPAQEEAPNAQRAARADTEPYARRNLHLQPDGDGVRAWIRDAALDGMQARGVVEALAAELARQGTPLTAVVLNGRTFAAPAGQGDGDEAGERGAAPEAAGDGFSESAAFTTPIEGVAQA